MKTFEESRILVTKDGWSAAAAARRLVEGGEQEEPFFMLELGEVAARLRRWRELLPRVEPFYAVKSNNHMALLRTLAALGTGFDCASKAEIELVTRAGGAPERIVFAQTAKLPSHLRLAARIGVRLLTFDCGDELIKIKAIMPHAQLLLRIRCDATAAGNLLGCKFGCDPDTEGPKLLELAAELKLDVAGVAFHVGSITTEAAAYARGVRLCAALFARGAALGLRMRVLDIGGGFLGHSHSDIQPVACVINEALETHFPERSVRVIAEPGRYFSDAAFTLAAMVYAKREVSATEGREAHTMYFVNDGMYGSFMERRMTRQVPEVELLHPSVEQAKPCSVWGPTCDGRDCVLQSARLPPLQVGSWLLFRDMGAYTMTLASGFNGYPLARVHCFVGRELWSELKDRKPYFTEADFELSEAEPIPPIHAEKIITS